MKQLKVALSDGLRLRITQAAKGSGRSLADEIRHRVERSFNREDAADEPTRDLAEAVERFAVLIRLQTGHDWRTHPASNRVMRQMVSSRLARLGPQGEPFFAHDELPRARLVAPESNDVEAMAIGLEALDFYRSPPLSRERLDELFEQDRAEVLKRFPDLLEDT